MNPIPEPAELFEAECNALGLYGLPEAMPPAMGAYTPPDRERDDRGAPDAAGRDPAG